ncbi:uncharacterized protein LOC129583054 [Paramacrobiotus metropolitanus]|uniref:uncharacterized protein LOC129583054 n=1 Tax=Paramacrobiotus metropolitanus TaxID=2943436 RepID=UPI0024465A61|nr:uncharacterized protein LOC129583054 [Paramacrobiotus metropolitanus]
MWRLQRRWLLFLPLLLGLPTSIHAMLEPWDLPNWGGWGRSQTTTSSPEDLRLKYGRPCMNYVLSGCSAKWKYCGCDTPAFNLSNIAPNASSFEFGDWNAWIDFCTPSCLLDTFTPLPHRPNLTSVELTNIWAAPDDRPFPVAGFLVNLQSTLTDLLLSHIYLPTITRETFAGFLTLRGLQLLGNRMSAIDANAFTALGERPGSALPQLSTLNINANNITTLDWSAFKPLMSSVKRIVLINNNIQRIFLSRFYVLHGVESVDLADNHNLTSVDNRFLRSFSSKTDRPHLNLEETALCSSAMQCQRISKIYGPFGDGICCSDFAYRQSPAEAGLGTTTEEY